MLHLFDESADFRGAELRLFILEFALCGAIAVFLFRQRFRLVGSLRLRRRKRL